MYLGLRKKNPAEAIDYFERAQSLDPSLAGQAKTWMAVIRDRQENPEEAEALYKSALAVEKPNSVDALNTMMLYARFLKEQGREYDSALKADIANIWGDRSAAAQAPQANSNAVKVGGGVTAPSLLYKLDPEYTEEARFAKYSGTVVLYLEVGPDGIGRNIRVVKGIGLGLDECAIAAIEKWRFKPATEDGAPVTVQAHVEVNFRLL